MSFISSYNLLYMNFIENKMATEYTEINERSEGKRYPLDELIATSHYSCDRRS